MLYSIQYTVSVKQNKKDPLPAFALRREWGFAPLCGAESTFSTFSKDPSRPLRGGLF